MPGAAVMPVLNVSSRVTWLELDDNALLESNAMLQEGILCDSFSQKKSVQLHGRAPLDKGLRSPLSCLAIWLARLHAVAKEPMAHLCYQGGSHRAGYQKRPFVKNSADCSPSICGWRSSWAGMCCPTGCTRQTIWAAIQLGCQGQPKESLWRESLPWTCPHRSPGMVGAMPRVDVFLKMPMCATGPGHQRLSACIPGQGRNALVEFDAFMDYYAKRWQMKEGTYQLKRRRLLPDVRDPPEQGDDEVDITDIWAFTWMAWRTHFMVEEMLSGAERGASIFTSLRVFTAWFCLCWVCVFVFVLLVCRFCWWKLLHLVPVSFSFANS